MIETAQEFVRLRESDNLEEYNRAGHDCADIATWYEVIEKYPDFKKWVIHNKTVPVEILEVLAKDSDPNVRGEVARKINDAIIFLLAVDASAEVRYALMCNTKISIAKKKLINTEDSKWLRAQMKEEERKQNGVSSTPDTTINSALG